MLNKFSVAEGTPPAYAAPSWKNVFCYGCWKWEIYLRRPNITEGWGVCRFSWVVGRFLAFVGEWRFVQTENLQIHMLLQGGYWVDEISNLMRICGFTIRTSSAPSTEYSYGFRRLGHACLKEGREMWWDNIKKCTNTNLLIWLIDWRISGYCVDMTRAIGRLRVPG